MKRSSAEEQCRKQCRWAVPVSSIGEQSRWSMQVISADEQCRWAVPASGASVGSAANEVLSGKICVKRIMFFFLVGSFDFVEFNAAIIFIYYSFKTRFLFHTTDRMNKVIKAKHWQENKKLYINYWKLKWNWRSRFRMKHLPDRSCRTLYVVFFKFCSKNVHRFSIHQLGRVPNVNNSTIEKTGIKTISPRTIPPPGQHPPDNTPRTISPGQYPPRTISPGTISPGQYPPRQCWNCPILGGGLGFLILWSTCRRTKSANHNPAIDRLVDWIYNFDHQQYKFVYRVL